MKLLIISLLFFSPLLAAGELFKYVNSEGVTVYTDEQPFKDAKALKLKPLQTTRPIKAIKKKPKPKYYPDPAEAKVTLYKRFSISLPIANTAMRDNAGNVQIKLKLQPKLNTKIGDRIDYYLDGKLVKKGSSSSTLTLKNVDRGEHRIKAIIKNKKGKKLKSTKTIKFTLLRFSKLHNR